MTDLLDRMANKFTVGDDCWEWTAAIDKSGYGRIGNKDKVLYAHRVMYEFMVGPIPEGLHIDHLCRVRHCIRPDHMEPVTRDENTRRGRGFAAENARKTHCIHGHEFSEENTYVAPKTGWRDCKACARARERRRLS